MLLRRQKARPTHSDLARYARAYRLSTKPSLMFPMWQAALAHAMLLDHDGDRVHEDHGGLNGRQEFVYEREGSKRSPKGPTSTAENWLQID